MRWKEAVDKTPFWVLLLWLFIYWFNLVKEKQFKMYNPFFKKRMPTAEYMFRKLSSLLPVMLLRINPGLSKCSLKKPARTILGFQALTSLLQTFNGGFVAPKQPQTEQKWMGRCCSNTFVLKGAQAWFHPSFHQQLLSLQDPLQRQVFNLGSLGPRFLHSLKSFAQCCWHVFLFVWVFFRV